MGDKTSIEWADSTLNLMMGCDGCELWERDLKHCYAGVKTEERKGQKGWPAAFDQPVIFPERMEQALKWKDLSYQDHSKHWLNGMPRVIFVNDMGDGFTRLLDDDWLAPFIPQMESSPHIFIMLTKRPQRMREFWKRYGPVPDNIWLGVSITEKYHMNRAYMLIEQIEAKTKILSLEPLLEAVVLGGAANAVQQVIVGFESGMGARPGNEKWMRSLRDECELAGTSFFLKQMGGVRDKKSLPWQIPPDLFIRGMPAWEHLEWKGKTQRPAKQIALGLD